MNRSIFVDFRVSDLQGTNSLSGYALPQSTFTFVPILSSPLVHLSTKRILWDFGDGTTSTAISATHHFAWPGEYKISAVVYDVNGDAYISSFTPFVSVFDFLPNQLIADTVDSVSLDVPAGRVLPFSVKRINSWQTYNSLSATGYTINLYVSGSLDPLANLEQFNSFNWSHLLQQCYFYKKQETGNTFEYIPISAITTSTEKIYAALDANKNFYICPANTNGSFLVGTSGEATVYFTSNKPKNYSSQESPLIIFCSLDASRLDDNYTNRINYYKYNAPKLGYLNTQPAVLYAYSRYNPATNISFTTNGIDTQGDAKLTTFEIPKISWQNTIIPFVAKLEDDYGFSTKFYPLLSSTVLANNFNVALLSGTSTNDVVNASFYPEFLDTLPSDVGGYYKGYFLCTRAIPTAYLSACAIVSNPDFYKFNTVNTIYTNASGSSVFIDQDIISLQGNTQTQYFNQAPQKITNIGGSTYAVVPSSENVYKQTAWTLSGDNLVKFDNVGNIINNYNLSTLLNTSVSSVEPASIALDGNNDVWVTLFNSSSTIKVNDSGEILAIAYKDNLSLNTSPVTGTIPSLTLSGLNLISPLYVETDKSNNIWVSYCNPKYNYLVKYDTLGNYLTSVSFGPSILPDKIIADKYNNIWIVGLDLYSSSTAGVLDVFTRFDGTPILSFAGDSITSLPLSGARDRIYKLSTPGTIIASVTGLHRPSSITYDLSGDIWVTHYNNTLTRIDRNTLQFTNYLIGTSATNTSENVLFAAAGNTYNKIVVYNLIDNALFILDATTPTLSTQYNLSNAYITDTGDDFNGFRWITKYAFVSAATYTVSGLSNEFAIYPDSGMYQVTKQNEDFDMKGYYNTLKLPEYLVDKSVLFNDFIGSIFGSVSSMPYELGKTIYERIANFGDNITNVDRATVESLISLSKQTGSELSNVIYDYPPQLRRIVDLLSIKHSNLFGTLNKFAGNFSTQAGLRPHNLGAQINTITGTFSLSDTLVAYEKFSNQYRPVKMPALSTYPGSYTLSLSNFNQNWGLPLVLPFDLSGSAVGAYYDFYRYVNTPLDNTVDSVINWNDALVTLSRTNSSYSDWVASDGIMDNIINYELTKGLRLFTSAVDIVYNN